jgi:hypothetical protein
MGRKSAPVVMPKASKSYQGKSAKALIDTTVQQQQIAAKASAVVDLEGLKKIDIDRLEAFRDLARRRRYSPSPPSGSRESEVPSDDELTNLLSGEDPNEVDDLKTRFGWIPSFYKCYVRAFGLSVDEVRGSIVGFDDVEF